jgi:hypothetical protein
LGFVRIVFNLIIIPIRIIRKVILDTIHLKELIPDPNETNVSDIGLEFK